jgi:pentatricopeptide repeat protein
LSISFFINALNAAIKLKDLTFGKVVHHFILNNNVNQNLLLINTLLNMYNQCSDFNATILFWKDLCKQKATQDSVTYSTVLVACANLKLEDLAEQVYKHFLESGLAKDGYINSAMLNVYASTGNISAAQTLFKNMQSTSKSQLDVVAYNIMLKAYPSESEYINIDYC